MLYLLEPPWTTQHQVDLVRADPEKTTPIFPMPSASLTNVMTSLMNTLIIPYKKEEVEEVETETPEQVESVLRSAVSSVVQCLQEIRHDRIRPGSYYFNTSSLPLAWFLIVQHDSS